MKIQKAKKDRAFQPTNKPACDFEFNSEVAKVFDDMLARSVPFYQEQQGMVRSVVERLWIPGTKIYDLGCYRHHVDRAMPATSRYRPDGGL